MIIFMALLVTPFTAYAAASPDWLRNVDLSGLGGDHLYSAFVERPIPRVQLRGARITDWEHGVSYECVGERRAGVPVLLRKTVIPHDVDTVHDVTQIDDRVLAVLTVGFLEDVDSGRLPDPFDPSISPADQIAWLDNTHTPTSRPRRLRPSLERIARDIADVNRLNELSDSGTIPARQVLRDRYRVSLPTVDKWIASARAAGLVEPAIGNRGRPRTKTSQEVGTK